VLDDTEAIALGLEVDPVAVRKRPQRSRGLHEMVLFHLLLLLGSAIPKKQAFVLPPELCRVGLQRQPHDQDPPR
jgi:hypothetical protein